MSRDCGDDSTVPSLAGAIPVPVLPDIPVFVLTLLLLSPLPEVPVRLILRVLRLEDERCRREGVGWLVPESMWFAFWSVASAIPADIDEFVDTTEADC